MHFESKSRGWAGICRYRYNTDSDRDRGRDRYNIDIDWIQMCSGWGHGQGCGYECGLLQTNE